jgi:syntaxin 16
MNKKMDNSENAALIDNENHQILELSVLPPKWYLYLLRKRVDIVEVVEEEIKIIKERISFLESLQRKHLMPGFDDRGGEEYSIEKTSDEIMNLFSSCQKKITNIPMSPNQAQIVGKNIQTSLATKLQETSGIFKKIQSEYLNKLKARESKNSPLGKTVLHGSDEIDVPLIINP